ncbi:hypothetical protein [Streptomyces sp. TR02-1]|uniref:hypothetical protein n=1 Tax=Streptomyces sp. TR02-1 TaxID=3385977 RepID=UPI0039A34D90
MGGVVLECGLNVGGEGRCWRSFCRGPVEAAVEHAPREPGRRVIEPVGVCRPCAAAWVLTPRAYDKLRETYRGSGAMPSVLSERTHRVRELTALEREQVREKASTPRRGGPEGVIGEFRWAVENSSFVVIDGIEVDLFTASLVVAVHDGLQKPENRKRFTSHPVSVMIGMALRLAHRTCS